MFEQVAEIDSERKAEYTRRRKPHHEKTINPKLRDDYEADGWIHLRDLKSGAKMAKAKPHDEILENRIWCILYQLGYPVMNEGRHFRIPVAQSKDKIVTKQVDVFAKDDETVIIIECKSCAVRQERNLRKDLLEFAGLRKELANSIRKHFGPDFKPKILWAFATWNVDWKKSDLALAKQKKIEVIKDREIRYLEEISKSLRAAGRYQFHAEFFRGQKIPELSGKAVPAIATKLGGHKAFIFCVDPNDLLKLSFVNHRDLRNAGSAPSYQRLLNKGRLKKIAEFLEGDNFFPNSILVSFHHKRKRVRFDVSDKSYDKSSQFGTLYLPNTYKSFWVIDGQHRLYGCALSKKPPQSLTVIAFENITQTLEADLFTTINYEQQRVSKRLLDELHGELDWDSPDVAKQIGAIAARAIDILNAETGGPFSDRLCPPGIGPTDDQNLTLPQIKTGILQSGLLGRYSKATNSRIPGACTGRTNEDSLQRLIDLLSWYFKVLREANPERWEQGKTAHLRNNFGVAGHIRLLGEVAKHLETKTSQIAAELTLDELQSQLKSIVSPAIVYVKEAPESAFTSRFKTPFGSGGAKKYFYELCRILHDSDPTFRPPGFDEHMREMSEEVVEDSKRRWVWINDTVHDYVVVTLKENYGDNFFQAGIANKEIKKNCFSKMTEDPVDQQKEPYVYLDFIDLKKIVEQKENWPLFSEAFNIQLPDEKKGKAKYLTWFDEVNFIRRVFAHSYNRKLGEDGVETLEFIEEELRERLPDYVRTS